MKNWALIDYLYFLKPIYMGLLFAFILFACKQNGDIRGVSRQDTTQAATLYGKTGPTALSNRVMNSGDIKPGASFTHVFTQEGDFPYFCRYHGGPKGMGMSGVVRVAGTGTPTTHQVTISEYDYPDLNVHVGDTVVWRNATEVVHTVEMEK